MLTNFLGKTVKYLEFVGEISAVYQRPDSTSVFFLVATQSGQIISVYATDCTLCESKNYYIRLTFTPEKKIMAVKSVRDILKIDLYAAKNLVDSNPNGIDLKDINLTHKEAMELRNSITSEGIEIQVKTHDCNIE